MKFIFLKNEAHINFSWRERLYVFFKGVFKMDYLNAKHMTNHFLKMAHMIDMQTYKDGETRAVKTFEGTEVELKKNIKDKLIC